MSRSKPGNRNAYCSFCRKSYTDVGPLVEGPDEVYICAGCIQLCQEILDQEKARRSGDKYAWFHSKIERMRSDLEDIKWNMEHQLQPIFGDHPSEAHVDRLLQLLREIEDQVKP